MLYTTLKLLRKANACSEGMATLTKSLGPSYTDSQEITLSHILESNGLNHAIWAMQATTVNCKQQIVELATKFAFESLGNFEKQFPNDSRPRQAIEAADLFMQGKITLDQLYAARSAAESARSAAESARSAAESARSAAWSAAWSAAEKRQRDIFLLVIS